MIKQSSKESVLALALSRVTAQRDQLLIDLRLAQQMVEIESKRANDAERKIRPLNELKERMGL